MTFPYANVWYNITEPGTSLVSSSILYNNSGTTGSVYLNYTSSNVHSWQFYPIGGGSQYILRTQALGPNATMQTVSQGGEIVVQMQSGPITNASLWSMTTWGTGDGTYYFTNEAIGNGSYMDTNAPGGVGLVWMNSDTSISNLGQRWKIHSLSSITESAFSTVSTRTGFELYRPLTSFAGSSFSKRNIILDSSDSDVLDSNNSNVHKHIVGIIRDSTSRPKHRLESRPRSRPRVCRASSHNRTDLLVHATKTRLLIRQTRQ